MSSSTSAVWRRTQKDNSFLLGRHCDHVGGDQPQQSLHRSESNVIDTLDLEFFHTAASCPAAVPSDHLGQPLTRRDNSAATVAGERIERAYRTWCFSPLRHTERPAGLPSGATVLARLVVLARGPPAAECLVVGYDGDPLAPPSLTLCLSR